jgi:hypothetical protein
MILEKFGKQKIYCMVKGVVLLRLLRLLSYYVVIDPNSFLFEICDVYYTVDLI